MPKMKTDSGAKKRIKITGTGKLRRGKAFTNHLLEKKSSRRMRRLHAPGEVAKGDLKTTKRMLGL